MPVTFLCFSITALSISGVWPFNGFFSKELVYDAALERHLVFYLAAVAGSFFTAVSFLKLGHAAFFGRLNDAHRGVKEVPWPMLLPMILIALLCVLFGLFHPFPIAHFIMPVLDGRRSEGPVFNGFSPNWLLIAVSVLVFAAACLEHAWAAKKTGSGLHAADPICRSPLLSGIYDRASKRYFDPYDAGMKLTEFGAKALWRVDRAVDWFYEGVSAGAARSASFFVSRMHSGSHVIYMVWVFLGTGLVLWMAVGR